MSCHSTPSVRNRSNFAIISHMQKYELTVLVKTVTGLPAGRQDVEEKMEKIIKALGGKLGKFTEMGKKQLAYPIDKIHEAHFLNWIIELPNEGVVQLEKKLINDKEVLRHLVICLHDR